MNNNAALHTDDGQTVRLGDWVWVNHLAGHAERPTRVRLVAAHWRGDGESVEHWPFSILYHDKDGKEHRYRWAHIYSTRDAAVQADPWPEIQSLRRRIADLEQRLGDFND